MYEKSSLLQNSNYSQNLTKKYLRLSRNTYLKRVIKNSHCYMWLQMYKIFRYFWIKKKTSDQFTITKNSVY